jgi:hypothetical protein
VNDNRLAGVEAGLGAASGTKLPAMEPFSRDAHFSFDLIQRECYLMDGRSVTRRSKVQEAKEMRLPPADDP